MKTLLQNLVKYARVRMGGKDDKEYPIQQVEYNGKVGDVFIVFPYGMHANLPEDCILGLFAVNANEQNRFGIGGLPNERIKNLPKGEVVFFHPLTKSKIHFKNDGNIDIDSIDSNINVNCNQASVVAKTILDFTAPEINLNGIINASGIINANGGVNIPTQTITVQGIDIGPTHKHLDGTYKAGATDVSGVSGDVQS